MNPRDSSAPPRRFRVARLRPLGHPSASSNKLTERIIAHLAVYVKIAELTAYAAKRGFSRGLAEAASGLI